MEVVKKRWLKKGIAKLRSCQTPAGYSSSCTQEAKQYGCPDFSMAKIRPGPSGRHTWSRCKGRSVGIESHAFPCAGNNS